MPANITIYCLDEITDYFDFERLCTDLMALSGHRNIEPLGGFSDKGRDAVHVDATSGRVTIFAYSVREDWRAKLAEDAGKIQKHGHPCDRMAFLTPARITAGERDEAVRDIKVRYGWDLDLCGGERLRVLLEDQFPHVRHQHPAIFAPALLAYETARGAGTRDHLYICCAPEDRVFADWLVRRLVAEGYLVWYEYFKSLGGEAYPEDVDDAISERAVGVISLYSRAALSDPDVTRQRHLALNLVKERGAHFYVPIEVEPIQRSRLDRVSAGLAFVPFFDSWAKGLGELLSRLEAAGCPRPLGERRAVAAETFLEQDVLLDQKEVLVTNCLSVKEVPSVVRSYITPEPISERDWDQLRLRWACRRLNPNEYLSFFDPPSGSRQQLQLSAAEAFTWRDVDSIRGIRTGALIPELIRVSLEVKCMERGLAYCEERRLRFFPEGLVKNDRLPYVLPTGAKNYIGVRGKKKYWRPSGSSVYKYALAPTFRIAQNLNDEFVVLVRLPIHFTDPSGNPLPKSLIKSRRKDLCRDWWNDDWLKRIKAVIQFLADDDLIVIGDVSEDQLVIDANPVVLTAPTSINEPALTELKAARAAFLRGATEDEEAEGGEDG